MVSKSVLVALATTCVAALGFGLTTLTPTAAQPPTGKSMPVMAAQPTVKPDGKRPATEQVTYSGKVEDAAGTPVADARVYYYFLVREDEPLPVRATTGIDGRFSFTLTRADVPPSADAIEADPLRRGFLIAKADGFAFTWAPAGDGQGRTDCMLRTEADDTPVTGRVVDLQGKPLAGLRVSAIGAAAPAAGDLTEFVKTLEGGQTFYKALGQVPNYWHCPFTWRRRLPLLPSATTDAAGRFRLTGFAREQLVELRIEGPAIETQTIFVMTRPGGRPLTPQLRRSQFSWEGEQRNVFVLPNGGEHVAPPGLVVTGTVRDAETGRPVPGAVVESYMLAGTNLAQNTTYQTATDAAGQYRLSGLPRGAGNRIRIRGGSDLPHLPVVKTVPDPGLFRPAMLDVVLKRGVWVDVRATDKATGQPAPGYVSYFVLPESQHDPYFPHPEYADGYDDFKAVRNDGTYRFAAAPAKAVLAFRADGNKYPIAPGAATRRLPSGLSPSNFQAFADLDPRPAAGPVSVEFVLDVGKTVTGRLVGPGGEPVAGALACGLRHDWFTDDGPQRTEQFTAFGLDPRRPRRLAFAHVEKNLAGSVVVRGDEPGPVTVEMRPWAKVTGRLVGPDGRPVATGSLRFTEIPVRQPGQPADTDTGEFVTWRAVGVPDRSPKLNADGRFTADGLVPGLKYHLAVVDDEGARVIADVKWTGLVFRNLVLAPGEARDMGVIPLKPFPKE
jgi:hypothetical protein